jgi:hypothetical protein
MAIQNEHDLNQFHSHNWSVHLIKVYTLPLYVALDYQLGLVLHNLSVFIVFHFEHPFQTDDLVSPWQISK